MNHIPLIIGLRYTRAKRRNQFISFVSAFSLLGMALGVLALIVVLSVLNGFDHELKQRILNAVPHGFISSDRGMADWSTQAAAAKAHPRVLGAAPFVGGYGLVSFGNSSEGVEIQGVLPAEEAEVSAVNSHMYVGEFEDLRSGEYSIVLGKLLAMSLGITRGDQVTLSTTELTRTPAGPMPTTRRFTVVGVFEVGAQIDQTLALIHMDDAQRLFRRGDKVDGIRIKVDDIYQAAPILGELKAQFGEEYKVTDWSQTQGSLFQAIKMEKIVIMIMLMIIIAIAAFNIVTSLVLMVADKRGDIAVLRTLGMTARQIMAVFIVQGSAVGIVGMLIGVALGCLGAFYIGDIVSAAEQLFGARIFDPNVYFISSLPSVWKLSDTLIVAATALLMSVCATLYPAYRASRIAPAEALRYE